MLHAHTMRTQAYDCPQTTITMTTTVTIETTATTHDGQFMIAKALLH